MIIFKGDTCWDKRTFLLHGVLIENIQQLIFTTRFPVFGVVSSIVFHEGKINTLLIHQRQNFDMLQEFISNLELTGAHPVGAQLYTTLYSHKALVLRVQERGISENSYRWYELFLTFFFNLLSSDIYLKGVDL